MKLRNVLTVLFLGVLLLFPGFVSAGQGQGNVEKPPFQLSSVKPHQQEAVNALLSSYHEKFLALDRSAKNFRMKYDILFAEMVLKLDKILAEDIIESPVEPEGLSVIRSAADCATACSEAGNGVTDIIAARTAAAAACSACPNDTDAEDSYSNAHASLLFGVDGEDYACRPQRSLALSNLEDARDAAYDSWASAWYSYDYGDGCAKSYTTAVHASNAYVHFHNARYAMFDCY